MKTRYGRAVMNTFGPPRLVLERGEGAYVWDEDGHRYLDLFAGIAVNVLGHAHPALVSAVTEQMRTLGHVSNFFASRPQVELAERLLDLLDSDGHVFLANSGAEANEAALKLTRRTGRSHVVAAEGGFHGRTMGALSLTHKAAYREPFRPLPGEVSFVPYGDAAALKDAVTDRTAAVVLEPIQGEAGVVEPPAGYLRAAREVTSARGALLWLDEVQTGIGRTGSWFAHDSDEMRPDLVTLAKGLAGGFPIGACVALGAAGDLLQPGHHGSTFGGNPVAAAAALAVLDTIEKEALLDNAREVGRSTRAALSADERVSQVRGRGLLIGLDLRGPPAPDVQAAAQRAGFLVNACSPTTLRLAPPLILTAEQAGSFCDAWPAILDGAR
jgi:acetylornithine aminotransferase